MSLFTQIVSEEKSRIKKMISDYERELATLPKGTLVCKTVKSNKYYYLQYREGKKMISSYIGNKTDIVEEIIEQVNRRRHIEAMLKNLRSEYAQANKIPGT